MNRQVDFDTFRIKYPNFIYKSYSFKEEETKLILNYIYEVENLTTFNHKIEILKEDIDFNTNNTNLINNLVFHIGLVDLVSYWKATCSPNIIIECGKLEEEQKEWFKKLYYYGLGEMLYVNNITVSLNDFVKIECLGSQIEYEVDDTKRSEYLIPIGGGKDSCVTLSTLKNDNNYGFIVNPKEVTLRCAEVANCKKIVKVIRLLDKELLKLNENNYLNGHTPFSAMIAFLSTFVAYLTEKKYIALSNESSANESNVVGTNVNHQYSKSLEFENDFRAYSLKYLKTNTEYFSFLRPILEVQIAYLFSKHEEYHHIFKSCNVGSKNTKWNWCCNCAKCLFVYIILSPFLYKEKLIDIFGEDLYENESLKQTFIDLLGYGTNKPFDCVGTYDEVKYAIKETINKLGDEELPCLLKYYKDNYDIKVNDNLLDFFSDNHNLNEEQLSLLKEALYDK